MKNNSGITIGLVIRNEEKYIENCLTSIFNLDFPADHFEVLVADGLSNDNTLQIIEKFRNKKNLRVIKNEKKIISAGRNLIINNAKFNLIAFTDGDCEVSTDWLSQLIKYINNKPNTACVGGPNVEFENDLPLAKLFAEIQGTFLGSGGSAQSYEIRENKEVDSIPNCNALYKKEWLIKAGKYDENFNVGEDADINFRIKHEGGLFYFNSKAIVKHHRRSTFSSFAKNNFNYGSAMARLFKKYKKIIRWYAPLPSGCIILGACLLVFSIFSENALLIFLSLITIYILINITLLVLIFKKHKNAYSLLAPLAYTIQIISYGFGFINGIFTKK